MNAALILDAELFDQFFQVFFQGNVMFQQQFFPDIFPLVVESLDMVVTEDFADAGRFDVQHDQPTQADLCGREFGVRPFQIREEPRLVKVGQLDVGIPDGVTLTPGFGEDVVESLCEQVFTASAPGGCIGNVSQQFHQIPDGGNYPLAVGVDGFEKFPDFIALTQKSPALKRGQEGREKKAG